MTWNLFIFIVVILISIAKLLDILFVYKKDIIHDKIILYWVTLSDTKFKDLLKISLQKINLVFDYTLGEGIKLYRNLLILEIIFITLFFYLSYIVLDGLTWNFFAPHIIWSSLCFLSSVVLTKIIIKKAIKTRSNPKILMFLFLDIVILIVLLSFNPWKSLFSTNSQEYYKIIEYYTHLPSDKLDNNILDIINKTDVGKLKSLKDNEIKYLIKRQLVKETIGMKIEKLVNSLKLLSNKFVIFPTLLNFIIIFIIFIMYLIAKPSMFLIERVLYTVAEDPKKSIFVIIASFFSAILALINAFIKI